MFELAALLALAANDEPITVELSPLSAHLLFAALGYAENLYNWTGSGYELTSEEIDQIQAIVARATDELTGG